MVTSTETQIPVDPVHLSTLVDQHGQFPATVKRILVPTDLTNESAEAIVSGITLAKIFGANLSLLHVYQNPDSRGYLDSAAVREKRIYFKGLLKSIAGEIRKHNVACDTQFLDGEPSEEIVKTAKELDFDLIIISTHLYNWLARLAFRCDAEQILRHVSCPVLILHVHKDQVADKNQ